MPTSRVLRGVLCNFLGTYTSRYSDFDGYWLLGLLVPDLKELDVDLLAQETGDRAADVAAAALARAVEEFRSQLAKSGLDTSRVASARLHIERLSATSSHFYDGPREGWDVRFVATATTDVGRRYECVRTVFVAPHDPQRERRSARLSS